MKQEKTYRDREILTAAHERGGGATLGAYFKLSGPGWLQSAITLGGGSLGGALYLGVLAGTSMLWLQLVAIVIGVIMLSAISYVTLSTGRRPYAAINEYVNPVLGVGWITATILANMIWIMPQFSLCFDSLDTCLSITPITDSRLSTIIVSAIIAVAAFIIVLMSLKPGRMSAIFDWILKLLVGMIVVCFVLAVVYLARDHSINLYEVMLGFVPNLFHWNTPSPEIQNILQGLPEGVQTFWKDQIIAQQQSSMIGVTATAVGINMTFLLPYSMLDRGWDRPFRGLARFDLITAMAIPYIVVTSCIVITSAYAFHAKADRNFLSTDPEVISQSSIFKGAIAIFEGRFEYETSTEVFAEYQQLGNEARSQQMSEFAAQLSPEERTLAATLVKPNAKQFASSLQGLLGEKKANLVFGLGALAMGFSTIIILSLINAYAFAEIVGHYESFAARAVGALAALSIGFCWFWIWQLEESKTWLIIVASTFGAIFLPIAYISFFALMNSPKLLGNEKPRGTRMLLWNVLMTIGVIGALAQAIAATQIQMAKPGTGSFVVGGVATFSLMAIVGFSARFRRTDATD